MLIRQICARTHTHIYGHNKACFWMLSPIALPIDTNSLVRFDGIDGITQVLLNSSRQILPFGAVRNRQSVLSVSQTSFSSHHCTEYCTNTALLTYYYLASVSFSQLRTLKHQATNPALPLPTSSTFPLSQVIYMFSIAARLYIWFSLFKEGKLK